jgi:hypothetical protein
MKKTLLLTALLLALSGVAASSADSPRRTTITHRVTGKAVLFPVYAMSPGPTHTTHFLYVRDGERWASAPMPSQREAMRLEGKTITIEATYVVSVAGGEER